MSAGDAGVLRVLVTGASRGIGRAVASALMQRGDRVALVARSAEPMMALVGERTGHAVVTADLGDAAQAEAAVDRAAQALGGLDAFVSCAGIVHYAAAGEIEPAQLQAQLAVNTVAPALMAQRCASHLARSGGGSIVFVTSTLAHKPAPMTAAYAASKAALEAFARGLALELGADNIRVNALSPGVIDTDMVRVPRLRRDEPALDAAARAAHVQAQLSALAKLHPVGRLGRPDDVAQSALYLLDQTYISGSVVVVDGGLSLGSGKP